MKHQITKTLVTMATTLGTFNVLITINPARTHQQWIDAVVHLGDAYTPGWRIKDCNGLNHGSVKTNKRLIVRQEVAKQLGISLDSVRGQALYSRLQPTGDGMARDEGG